MMEVPISNIVTAISSLSGVIVGVLLTNHLSYKRSAKEKISELRRAAYGSILSNFSKIESIVRSSGSYIEEDRMRYFSERGYFDRHMSAINEHMASIRSTLADNYLVLSDKFIEICEEFLRTLDSEDPNDTPPEEYDRLCTAVRAARPRILRQARSEMLVQENSWVSRRRWFVGTNPRR